RVVFRSKIFMRLSKARAAARSAVDGRSLHRDFYAAMLIECRFENFSEHRRGAAFDLPAFEHPDEFAIAKHTERRRTWRKPCEILPCTADCFGIIASKGTDHAVRKNVILNGKAESRPGTSCRAAADRIYKN